MPHSISQHLQWTSRVGSKLHGMIRVLRMVVIVPRLIQNLSPFQLQDLEIEIWKNSVHYRLSHLVDQPNQLGERLFIGSFDKTTFGDSSQAWSVCIWLGLVFIKDTHDLIPFMVWIEAHRLTWITYLNLWSWCGHHFLDCMNHWVSSLDLLMDNLPQLWPWVSRNQNSMICNVFHSLPEKILR